MLTKFAIILPDGAADEPVPALGGRTPLEAAATPNMDAVVRHGRIGAVRTVPEGFAPGSDVATMSLLGYDPRRYYTGRAPIEAIAQNVRIGPGEIVFRCNFVRVADGRMNDFTAGHVRTEEAEQLIAALNRAFEGRPIRFHSGVSYRNLMTINDPETLDAACMPPHDIPGEPIKDYLPKGKAAARLREIMDAARTILARHDVNKLRVARGEPPATDIWLWGQGIAPIMPRFRQRFGVRGAVIAAVDLIRGLGKLLGWPLIEVPGATGYLDTDYDGKGRCAAHALDEYDLVAVHVEAPDEAGHMGDAAAKIEALERIDKHVVGPVLEKLRSFAHWRILIAPDHPTPVGLRTHTAAPPPFCIAGSNLPQGLARSFSERAAADSDLHIQEGHELMEYFLRR